ncbi:hypothetical protein EJ110_NYTH16363 [Nymphaea thermarum]|nr:hypothetical protein EJ110_NYTH16363 [Nymphaea thermarum]
MDDAISMSSSVFPKFDISIGPTHWSTVVISDANTTEIREAILLANSDSISVCLSNASTGVPFISTLELRQFNDSMYYTNFETRLESGSVYSSAPKQSSPTLPLLSFCRGDFSGTASCVTKFTMHT